MWASQAAGQPTLPVAEVLAKNVASREIFLEHELRKPPLPRTVRKKVIFLISRARIYMKKGKPITGLKECVLLLLTKIC